MLRGLTVALMIMVNNAGDSYAFMHHAAWNGLTLADVVFPFFLFIMGASTYLSLSKSGFRSDRSTVLHIIRRTVIIILICWGIFWVSRLLKGDPLPFDHFRLTGVLVRIALVYCLLASLAITVDHKWMPWIAAFLMLVYALILLLGDGYANDASNILSRFDRALLGPGHVYSKAPVDPEGLLGLIPSLAQAILGFLCGGILRSDAPGSDKVFNLALVGAVLLAAGLAISPVLPVNKRVWSPSFALVTSGLAGLVLSLLIYLIDIRGRAGSAVCRFFKVFGTNALVIYALSELLGCVFAATGLSSAARSAIRCAVPDVQLSDLLYSILFMLLNFLAGLALYRRKIFIKI